MGGGYGGLGVVRLKGSAKVSEKCRDGLHVVVDRLSPSIEENGRLFVGFHRATVTIPLRFVDSLCDRFVSTCRHSGVQFQDDSRQAQLAVIYSARSMHTVLRVIVRLTSDFM